MNPKQKRRKELLLWRSSHYEERVGYQKLANSLSVEGIRDAQVPDRLYEALTEFRKLSQDAREAVCKRFLEELSHGR